jgi:hypothetical protein
METIASRQRSLMERIAAAATRVGRNPGEIRLIAVSKTVEPARLREAFAAGVRAFAENRAQELMPKSAALADLAIEWHFVGHLQSNKARPVMEVATLIHSVDQLDLARRMDVLATPEAPQRILVQVNTSAEETKSGVAPEALGALLDGIARLPGLVVEGLMTIGPLTDDRSRIRAAFRSLREARDRGRAAHPELPLAHLSMGMSDDYEIAIEEGATLIRIGSALFGSRAVI